MKERGAAGKKKVVEPVVQKKKETVHTETAKSHTHAADHTHEHGHEHTHAHPAHDHQHDHADHQHKPAPAKPAVKAKVAAEEQPSSAELLRRAQQKAAELKVREKERKDTEQVSNLYEELQKKGSLRSTGVRK